MKENTERERERPFKLKKEKRKKKSLELFCGFCEARLALNVPAEGPINHSADRARAISPLIGHSRHEGSRLARAAAHSLTHVVQVKEWRQGRSWSGGSSGGGGVQGVREEGLFRDSLWCSVEVKGREHSAVDLQCCEFIFIHSSGQTN